MPPARPAILTTNTIRLYRCRPCNVAIGTFGEKAEHVLVGHTVDEITLHRRARRAGNGVEVQWATDWKPAMPRPTSRGDD